MTDQATQKRYVRTQLETIWKRYAATLRLEDHELVILAVPTYPANIEAVSALDLSDINDIMAVFAKHREDHPDELHPIEPAIDQSPQSIEQSIHRELLGRQAADGAEQVGKGDDRAGPPQERAEPAPEQDEGDVATDAMELMPVFEIHRPGVPPIRIWANGRVDGVEGAVFNRIPELIARNAHDHYKRPPLDPPEADEEWFKRAKLVKPKGSNDD